MELHRFQGGNFNGRDRPSKEDDTCEKIVVLTHGKLRLPGHIFLLAFSLADKAGNQAINLADLLY
jgi:hypothetical protein